MLSSDLRNKIIEFIEKKIGITQFEDWLVPNLPSLISSPDSVDSDVVSAIELGLAEVSSDLRSQDEFIEFLLEVLREESIKTSYPLTSTTVISSSVSDNRYIHTNSLQMDNQANSNIIKWQAVGAD